jgi:hypothetical protein
LGFSFSSEALSLEASESPDASKGRAIVLSMFGSLSEHQLHGELKFARVLRALNHIEVGAAKDAARKIEVRMIQYIEDVEPELQF